MTTKTKAIRDAALGFLSAVAVGLVLMLATGAWTVFMGAWATKVTLSQHTTDITAVRSEHAADVAMTRATHATDMAAIRADMQRILDAVCYDKPQVPVCKK